MAQETQNTKLSSRILVTLQKELQKAQENLLLEEKKQSSGSAFIIQEEQRKLNNNMAKVEIAISDALYN